MPNLAGFDLVIEVARAAIERQILVTPSQTGPNGEVIDTFVPPFTLRKNISLPGMSGLLQLIVHELQLRAVPRTPFSIMHMSFAESSIEAPGFSVGMLAGAFDLQVPMRFTPPAGSPSQSRFALDFTAATASLQLSPDTFNRLQAQLGSTTANMVLAALDGALVGLFRARGLFPVGFSFTVDGTVDSTQMTTLTAVPNVSWIDAETLGLFGYHRRGANTGDVLRKTDSDLPSPPFAGFPSWYPVVVMISPDSFQRLIACPAVTKTATDHVAGPVREGFINEERARDNNNGPATDAEIAIANNRVSTYLASPAGLAEIASKTPAPCGRGALDQRINLPDPFPATTAYIDTLSMSLGNGRLDINAKAHADVFCGSVQVTLPLWVQPVVGGQKINLGPVNKGEPQTKVDTDFICKVATDVLLSFLIGPFAGSIATVAAFAIAESLAESLVNSKILDQNLPVPQAGIDLPRPIEWRSLKIDPSALMLIGQWPGELLDPHTFDPRIDLRITYDTKASQTVPTKEGTFGGSCFGGPAQRQFDYKLQAWDNTLKFFTTEQDVPHPLRYSDWIVTLSADDFSRSFTLQDGVALRTSGKILIPDPPDSLHAETREEIVVGVSGNNKDGWTLHFRGEDGVLYLYIDTRIIDASGRSWRLGFDQLRIDGQTIWLPDDYKQFWSECLKRFHGIISRFQLVRSVPRWEQVIAPEIYVEQTIRAAVSNREFGASLFLQKILAEQPELVEGLIR